MISRESIDVLKSTFRDDVCVRALSLLPPSVLRVGSDPRPPILRSSKSEWLLIAKYLKPLLDI